jgi:hypothetical protein
MGRRRKEKVPGCFMENIGEFIWHIGFWSFVEEFDHWWDNGRIEGFRWQWVKE